MANYRNDRVPARRQAPPTNGQRRMVRPDVDTSTGVHDTGYEDYDSRRPTSTRRYVQQQQPTQHQRATYDAATEIIEYMDDEEEEYYEQPVQQPQRRQAPPQRAQYVEQGEQDVYDLRPRKQRPRLPHTTEDKAVVPMLPKSVSAPRDDQPRKGLARHFDRRTLIRRGFWFAVGALVTNPLAQTARTVWERSAAYQDGNVEVAARQQVPPYAVERYQTHFHVDANGEIKGEQTDGKGNRKFILIPDQLLPQGWDPREVYIRRGEAIERVGGREEIISLVVFCRGFNYLGLQDKYYMRLDYNDKQKVFYLNRYQPKQ